MTALLAAAGGVIGLLAGSFINVVAYRVPRELSVVRPRSACPGCGHEIRSRDNVPVVSWLLLRGRCRDCGSAIAVRYPLVEAGTAAVLAALAWMIGPSWALPGFWWAAGVAIALTLTDLDVRRIPDRILLPGAAVTLVLLAAGALADFIASAPAARNLARARRRRDGPLRPAPPAVPATGPGRGGCAVEHRSPTTWLRPP